MSKADLIDRQAAIDALMEQFKRNTPVAIRAKLTVEGVQSAQPELIAQGAYVRGFEQGRTQGMLDAKLQQTCNKLATDTISRQAAIDAIQRYKYEHGFAFHACAMGMERDIKALPSAQPERDTGYSDGFTDGYKAGQKETQPEPQWIPRSSTERPKDREEVMVTIDDGYKRYTDTDEYVNGHFWYHDDKHIVAWKSFDEPWRGEEHETD